MLDKTDNIIRVVPEYYIVKTLALAAKATIEQQVVILEGLADLCSKADFVFYPDGYFDNLPKDAA
jgi:hypothetical protein